VNGDALPAQRHFADEARLMGFDVEPQRNAEHTLLRLALSRRA
jgi:hypothetical protein